MPPRLGRLLVPRGAGGGRPYVPSPRKAIARRRRGLAAPGPAAASAPRRHFMTTLEYPIEPCPAAMDRPATDRGE
ncbi:hypothetical protein CV103_20135 [Sphingomonas fennica]|uniref:Uncharacterized protein n=1 Tax=Edaphosphingomonas fennica TaxID=114404 RepID=A0A2T4HLQ2_9SPHN|nr:hypothetical protein CV103_20135 [Sphingomonas fennica]